MLMTKERRTAIRTVRGWAIAVLQEAGAIRECEYHGWMQDRADPHARERAFEIARQDPPPGGSAQISPVPLAFNAQHDLADLPSIADLATYGHAGSIMTALRRAALSKPPLIPT
ncbi:hypothetical protein ABIB83_008807 [Bradyrhizobium sp. I1.8.5]